jgi:hypothetical protein
MLEEDLGNSISRERCCAKEWASRSERIFDSFKSSLTATFYILIYLD